MPAEPPLVREDHRGLHLEIGDRPVLSEQTVLFLPGNETKAVLFIKTDGPPRRGPGPDQDRAGRLFMEIGDECSAEASIPKRSPHIGVPDEGHVLHVLDAHHADELPVVFNAPEQNAVIHFSA